MGAPANSQQAAKGLKNDLLQPSGGVITLVFQQVGHIRLCLALTLSFGHDP
jgi:hypothetical protein